MALSEGINPYLCITLLPPAMFIKRFVANESRCNYELYLLEVLNSSSFFLSLSEGVSYAHPSSENKGECDAVAPQYSVDFKLVEGNSRIEAKNLLSPGITKDCNGVICWHTSKRSCDTFAVYLNRALRRLSSADDIARILESDPKPIKMAERSEQNIEQQSNYELKELINNLLTEKNLLLFLPETFSFKDVSYGFDEATKIICEALEHDYRIVFDYRLRELSGFDTYLCCLFDDSFLIYQYSAEGMKLVDRVNCTKSETFSYLKREYADVFM